MDLTPELLKVLANGGIAVIVFVIWYVTYKTQTKHYTDLVERLFKQVEQDLKYKELLIGILTRLETKIDLHDRRNRNE